MESFLRPPPEVIAFFTLKKFLYLEILLVLAVARSIVARGPARWAGLVSVLLALLGLAAQFGPAISGASDGTLYRAAFTAVNAVQGIALPLVASLPLAISAVLRGRRWWGIDALHALLIAALVVLWGLGG
ncbi:hypothetical protein [Mesobacterium pallidum]|uniref:hypothetical protein n=1 Tax=Mesobacterium pallidum TaxID=2872037 RepID=UPI001EE2ABF8|nr:hypothetical protein [Mesobacterium pallidum]